MSEHTENPPFFQKTAECPEDLGHVLSISREFAEEIANLRDSSDFPEFLPDDGWSRCDRFQWFLLSWFNFIFQREFPLLRLLTRKLFPFLGPSFAWSNFTLGSRPLATTLPLVKQPATPFFPPATRALHWLLFRLSVYYRSWYRHFDHFHVSPLPFGLDLCEMHSAEANTTRILPAAGFPVAKIISCVNQPGSERQKVTVIMTRLSGENFHTAYKKLNGNGREIIKEEIHKLMTTMRAFESPYGQKVCNIDGGPVWSPWLPTQAKMPRAFQSEKDFIDFQFDGATKPWGMSEEKYEGLLETARGLYTLHCSTGAEISR